MTSIRNIVVGLDFSPGSQAALERALELAVAHGAALRLLHAFDVSAWHSLQGVLQPQRLTTEPPPDVQTRQHLNELAQTLTTRTGLEVQARMYVGSAGSAINSYVNEQAGTLVVIGARAEPGLGSTAAQVLNAPAAPVLVVRRAPTRPYQQLLLAVDLSDVSRVAAALAIRLYPHARHHLLYVLDPARERGVRLDATSEAPVERLQQAMLALAREQLTQLAQALPAPTPHALTTEVLDQVPPRAITERAAALPADCVVVGYGRLSPLSDRLLGNMALHVLQHTLGDVLVVP